MTDYQVQMLSLEETIDHLSKANSVRWYGTHELRKDKNNLHGKAHDFTLKGTRSGLDQREPG